MGRRRRKSNGQYIYCRIELAKKAISENRFADALNLLKETDSYPHNLGEGKLSIAEENEIDYYKGQAYQGLGEKENARKYFERATIGSSEPQQAFFYNDQNPSNIFYRGLAWNALGNEKKAHDCFRKLISHGEKHLNDKGKIDYFAVSLPDLAIWEDNLDKRNQIHCNYVMGLGYLGLNNKEKAQEYLTKVLESDVNHLDGQKHIQMIDF